MSDRPMLDAVINVRVTRAEKTTLRTSADIAGLSLSAYCRARFLGHRIVPHTDRATIRELRRIGGLLKRVHTESAGAYSRQTADALAEIQCFIEQLAK